MGTHSHRDDLMERVVILYKPHVRISIICALKRCRISDFDLGMGDFRIMSNTNVGSDLLAASMALIENDSNHSGDEGIELSK